VSLRTKIVALVLGLTVAILAGLWLLLSRSWGRWSIEAVDRDLVARTATIAGLVELDYGALELEEEHPVPALHDPAHPYRILSRAGVAFTFGEGPGWPEVELDALGPRIATHRDAGGREWRVATQALDVEPHHGPGPSTRIAVQVAGDPAPFGALEQRFRHGLLLALAAALLAGGVGAALLARVALAPLRRMACDIDAIGATSLDRRVGREGLGPELARVAASFDDLLDRLEEALRRERQLVSRASHALRTPTATILTRSEVALRREREPGAYREALEDVAAAARESATLVAHLLTLSRLDERRDRPALEDAPLAPIAGEVIRLLSVRAAEAGVSLEVDVPVGLVARVDRSTLRELLEALLDNAVRYTPRGGRAGVRGAAAPNGCAIAVWDTGPGIAAAERDRVLERFYRGAAAESSGAPGTGLGLSIVRAIAEAHRAELSLGTHPGGGLEVTVVFPAAAPHPASDLAAGAALGHGGGC
jgi:signal transduction histidine kinase